MKYLEMLIPKEAIDSENTSPFMEHMLNLLRNESESLNIIFYETGVNKDIYKYIASYQDEHTEEITNIVKEMFRCAVLTAGFSIVSDRNSLYELIDHVDKVEKIKL